MYLCVISETDILWSYHYVNICAYAQTIYRAEDILGARSYENITFILHPKVASNGGHYYPYLYCIYYKSMSLRYYFLRIIIEKILSR